MPKGDAKEQRRLIQIMAALSGLPPSSVVAVGNAVAAFAGKGGSEGYFAMTNPAILPLEYFCHIDRIASRQGNKYFFMAIDTGKPSSVRAMRKFYIGHTLCIFHDDVRIKYFHFPRTHQVGARGDDTADQCFHPVNSASLIQGEASERPIGFLQNGIGRAGGIVNGRRFQCRCKGKRLSQYIVE